MRRSYNHKLTVDSRIDCDEGRLARHSERFLRRRSMEKSQAEAYLPHPNYASMYHGTLISTMLRLPLTSSRAFSNSARWLCRG